MNPNIKIFLISLSLSTICCSVAIRGTWDGVHYGHRKLLTLAISSVVLNGGTYLIGSTTDDVLLKQKDFADFVPAIKEHTKGLKDFVKHYLHPE